MQIQFLGTGGAFDYEYGNSAAWIHLGGKNILLDCGNTIYARLRQTQLIDQIDYILISHCHDDHVGSLSTLLLHQTYSLDPPNTPTLLVPNPTFEQHLRDYLKFGIENLDRCVRFAQIDEIEGLSAIDTFGEHVPGMQSFGFCFEDKDELVVYSGDTGNPHTIFASIPKDYPKSIRVFHDITFEYKDGIHAYYRDVHPYLSKFEIFGYHLDPRLEPEDNRIPLVANFPELLILPFSVPNSQEEN